MTLPWLVWGVAIVAASVYSYGFWHLFVENKEAREYYRGLEEAELHARDLEVRAEISKLEKEIDRLDLENLSR